MVKQVPKLRMGGAVPPLALYLFTTSTRIQLPLPNIIRLIIRKIGAAGRKHVEYEDFMWVKLAKDTI
jgi:hypothetical protein